MKSQQQTKKLRTFATLLVLAALCLCGYQMSTPQKASSDKSNSSVAAATKPALPSAPVQDDDVIDGSKHPEKIPDHVAYGMVFRVIGNRNTEGEKKSIRAYVNQLGLGTQKCIACGKDANDEPENPEIETLVAVAQAYNRQVRVLDMQAKTIKDATWRNPTAEAKAELNRLQKKKESLIKQLVASLHRQLGVDASARLTEQINGRVKSRIQIRKNVDAP